MVTSTAEHPFWGEGRGWTPVRELQVGDSLASADGPVGVVRVEATGEAARVYNFHVDGLHNYHVGEELGAVRVHNNCTVDPKSVRFTQDSISPNFSNGKSVLEVAEQLRNGSLKAEDFPAIRTFERNGKLYSLDNRRLVAFQMADLPSVPHQTATAAEIAMRRISTVTDGLSIRIRKIGRVWP